MMAGYADAVDGYRAAGWPGVLPLPPRCKQSPPKGFTGDDGADPTDDLYREWKATRHGNTALRLPAHVVGVDVDAYKPAGAHSWSVLTANLSPLPNTWRTTSRSDGVSGIRLYRVPPGVRFRTDPAPGIEIVQRHHRYAIVAPSVHPEGGEYRWLDDEGEVLTNGRPVIGRLAELPDDWLATLRIDEPEPCWLVALWPERSGSVATNGHKANGPVVLPRSPLGYRSRAEEVLADAMARMTVGSRHDVARDACGSLWVQADAGNPGAAEALDVLGRAFVERVTADGSRSLKAAEKEWQDMVDGAEAKYAGRLTPHDPNYRSDERGQARQQDEGQADDVVRMPRTCLLPPEFWSARPMLGHIATAARARMVAPDALFGAVLVRACSLVDHRFVLPAVVGRLGSLNVCVGLAGRSGAGKGSSIDTAEALTPCSLVRWTTFSAGSGEGMVKQFFRREQLDDGGKKRTEWVQAYDAAMIRVDEGSMLGALAARQGQTTIERLREAYSGERLGSPAADSDRGFQLAAHAYRLSLIAAFQPELAGAILADTVGGTAQRFLWFATVDPIAPDPLELPDWPGPLKWSSPVWSSTSPTVEVGGLRRTEFGVAREVVAEIRTVRHVRLRGDVDGGDDTHRELSRLKVAAILAALDGRTTVSVEDWRLAGVVTTTSDGVRAWMRAAIGDVARKAEQAATDRAVRRTVATTQATTKVVQVAQTIRRKVEAGGAEGVSVSDAYKSVAGRDRKTYAALALDHAEAQGWVKRTDDGRVVGGVS